MYFEVSAPVQKGEKVGEVRYHLNGKQIGIVDIAATSEIKEITYVSALERLLEKYFAL